MSIHTTPAVFQKINSLKINGHKLAERVGFEPTVSVTPRLISNQVP
jgi:hypothetical protein